MYRMKRHSGAKKRFKKLSSNRVVASHQGRRHKLSKKTRARKRGLRQSLVLRGGDLSRMRQIL